MIAVRQVALRAGVLVTRWRLDAELAAGVDPDATPSLRLRAAQITAQRYRRRLAVGLLRLSNEAQVEKKPRLSAALPVRHDQLADARETLASLVQALLFAERVDARGVAMVRQLMADGGSPLYCAAEAGALEARLRTALGFLVDEPPAPRAGRRGPFRAANGGSVGGR